MMSYVDIGDESISYVFVYLVFFFKQKTAYEMRISDWSLDVCSSDLSSGASSPVSNHAGSERAASFTSTSHQTRCMAARAGPSQAISSKAPDATRPLSHSRSSAASASGLAAARMR